MGTVSSTRARAALRSSERAQPRHGWGRVEVLFRPYLWFWAPQVGRNHSSLVAPHSCPPKREALGGQSPPPTPPCSPTTVSVVVLVFPCRPISLHLYCPAWVSWASSVTRYASPSQIHSSHPSWQTFPGGFALQMSFQGALGSAFREMLMWEKALEMLQLIVAGLPLNTETTPLVQLGLSQAVWGESHTCGSWLDLRTSSDCPSWGHWHDLEPGPLLA